MRQFLFIILMLFSFYTYSQVTTGSLGDPTVEINFGEGSGIGPPLASVITTYTYSGNDCPIDGSYVINNKTSNCFNGSWHNLIEDHTPNDKNGYMMIVNASFDPGVFYTFAVDNICPKTSYELGAFILNLSRPNTCNNDPIKPNITFRIEKEDGELLAKFETSSIPPTSTPEWKKYTFPFDTPNGVSKIVLKMINNSNGGCGNDLAIDDITFRPFGPTITVGSLVNGNSRTVLNLCEQASANYSIEALVSAGYDNPAYQWQEDLNDGNGWADIPNEITTKLNVMISDADLKGYQYRMAAAEEENIQSKKCRIYSNPVQINVSPKLTVDAGYPIFILEGGQTKMNPLVTNGLTYEWSPAIYLDNPNIKQPTVNALENTTYTLTVTDPVSGCTASDDVKVTVDDDLRVTNSFSPNGDGVNDVWAIQGLLGNTDTDISIFNRNGQLVYRNKGYPKEWDGKLNGKDLPIGMYFYLIDTHSSLRPVYKGSLMIIR
ncbi:MAG: gliding motility-associated C-terminal domain-containing protein [Pelobium sp.]